ncbi:hypothetical protein ILUMI_23691 [Ignelater luminosus]|uniref:FAM21/CAPZIP domain-containing protein n=1 Tax=Ignelater luminosus TaxID=2038154 RepID=A0A8K0G1C8_IGNLU|nr:hypothetical protein ILUMI_23691 [Ignelater luminosus]
MSTHSLVSSNVNSWNRAWSAQEIIDNASNWSLAGDAGLLNYLETFSENLLSKAQDTNDNLNKLLEDLNSVSLNLDIVKNDFRSLHNFQFVESRVYEEDETLASENVQANLKDDKPNNEEKQISDMKEAVLRGIEVVDKFFDKVEIPASDSEDETDFPSFVLRPKDPYIDRPLPYVIGTDDWHKKWHVGLLDSSSESEAEKNSERYSDSDSESDLPVQNRVKQIKEISNSGSEADLLNRNINHPVANSTFDESIKQPDIFGSSDSEEYNSVPTQAPISNKRFARELAAKLGNVIEQNPEVTQPEVNKRPIQSSEPARNIGNIFDDEPPPIDQDDMMFGNSNAHQGLFSANSGLFDDLDDNLWKDKKHVTEDTKEVTKPKLPNLFEDDDDIFTIESTQNKTNTKDSANVSSKKIARGLFDDDSSEDDDLFSENTKSQPSSKLFLHSSSKTVVPYFSDEPPELKPKHEDTNKEDIIKAKKPVGGIKIFSGTDLFPQKSDSLHQIETKQLHHQDSESNKANKESFSDKSDDLFVSDSKAIKVADSKESDTANVPDIDSKMGDKSKQLSLFDDNDDNDKGDELFGDDLFSNISTNKFVTNLFDDEPLNNDIFAITNDDLSTTKPSEQIESSEKDTVTKEALKIESVEKDVKKSENISLFSADSDDEIDDLFSSNVKGKPIIESKISVEASKSFNNVTDNTKSKSDIQEENKSNVEKNVPSSVNINFFDQHPPDDDNEWDTKSENNLFEDNYSSLFDNTPELSSQRSGLFDSEPPSLFYESSGIVRDGSARAETDDSFNPFASSSRRFSSDIFNEQQSSDSFFVTKNKSHIDIQYATQSNLGSIKEIPDPQLDASSYSNVEITPSGNVDDLFSDSTISGTGENTRVGEETKDDIIKNILKDSQRDKDNLFDDFDLLSESKNGKIEKESCDDMNVGLFESSGVSEDIQKDVHTEGKLQVEKVKPSVATKPNLSFVENKNVQKDQAVESLEDVVAAKIGSPGKLKHSMNINVSALMPGMSPPKKVGLQKSRSFDVSSTDDNDATETSTVSSYNLSKSNDDDNKNESPVGKQSSFSENVSGDAEILPSMTKDRVRIPVKRRPSTRKARQELIRNSGTDFKLNLSSELYDAQKNISEDDALSQVVEKQTEPKKQKSKDEDLEESISDDLFADISNTLPSEPTKVTEKVVPIRDLSLFSSSGSSDSSLFTETVSKDKTEYKQESFSSSITEEVQKVDSKQKENIVVNYSENLKSNDHKKSDLFDDVESGDDDDDIFSTKKLPPKSNILKKSLFDDEFDDDDIFGPSTSIEATGITKVETKSSEKKPPKATHIKKLKNTEVEDDPLSAFNDN